jgi:hypothetical protein
MFLPNVESRIENHGRMMTPDKEQDSVTREVGEGRAFDSSGYRRFATALQSEGGKLDD